MERIVRRWCETCGMQWDGQASDPCPRIEYDRCETPAPALPVVVADPEALAEMDEAEQRMTRARDAELERERITTEPELAATLTDLAAWSEARGRAAWRRSSPPGWRTAFSAVQSADVSIPPRHAATMQVPASWSWSDSASPPVADITAEIRRLRTRSPA